MRTLRLSLVLGTVIVVLLAAPGGAAVAQGEYSEYTVEVIDEGSADDGYAVEASDPRMSGIWTEDNSCRGDETAAVCVGWVRVENEGGIWLGRAQRFGGVNGLYVQTVFEGQGGYEGLTALNQRAWDPTGRDLELGVIFEGELPAFPEPPADSLLALWLDAQSDASSISIEEVLTSIEDIDLGLPPREYLCQQLEAWAAYVHFDKVRAGVLEEPSGYCD